MVISEGWAVRFGLFFCLVQKKDCAHVSRRKAQTTKKECIMAQIY